MRPARFISISLLLVAPAVWSQTGSTGDPAADQATELPADIVAECSRSADGDVLGLQELEAVCPGLEHALVELGYAPLISASQLDELSVHSLVDLQHLADRYREPASPAGEIETASLTPILQALQQDRRSERPLTLFERIKKWLRSVFDKPQRDSESWLNRWLEDVKVSEAVSRAIVYGLVILVIVLAIAVLVNELRAAGLLRRKARAGKDVQLATDAARDPAARTLADLDAVAPNDRPSVLLRMLVATLVKTGRLRTERSLTHRELGLRAAFEETAQRECFQRVAALGERVVYGDGQVPDDEVETIVQAGRTLNLQLAAPGFTPDGPALDAAHGRTAT